MYLNKFVSLDPFVVGEIDVATGSVLQQWQVPVRIQMREIQAKVSTALSSSGAVVVTFFRRPTFGSSSGEVSIGVLTVPAATAVGATIYKDVNGGDVNAGEILIVKLTTAATTSGKMMFSFVADEDPEVVANQSKLTLSA